MSLFAPRGHKLITPSRKLSVLAFGLFCSLAISPVHAIAQDAFVDVAESVGVDFTHTHGAVGGKHLIETMSGGGGWLDYDGDGDLDLYLVNGHDDVVAAAQKGRQSNKLFENRGGKFFDVTERAKVGDRGYGFGMAVGDIDNDGDQDLYVTNFGANTLYLNQGDGSFLDITAASGTGCPLWSTSACFADINGDGLLDLYVCNYLVYDPRIHKACTGNGQKLPSYCHPNKFDGPADALYLNTGGGRFRDISKSSGIAVSGRILSKGLGVISTDFDMDGKIDFLVANDSVPNFLWRNLGNGKFEDAGIEAGVSLNTNGKPEACMGVDGADINGDGWPDFFITNFSQETDTLFLSEQDGFFEDATLRAKIGQLTYTPLGFGTRFVDYDLDGDFDIFVARGHIMDNIQKLNPGSDLEYKQSDQLLQNHQLKFRDVSASSGAYFKQKRVGRAAAFADYDNDGDLDILVVNVGDKVSLLENKTNTGTASSNWVGAALQGFAASNPDAYGARVEIIADGKSHHYEVRSTASYLSANDPRISLGLGTGNPSKIEARVTWPSGKVERFGPLLAKKYNPLVEGRGRSD